MKSSTVITLIALPIGYWVPTLLYGTPVNNALIMTCTTWLAVGMLRFNEWREGNDE